MRVLWAVRVATLVAVDAGEKDGAVGLAAKEAAPLLLAATDADARDRDGDRLTEAVALSSGDRDLDATSVRAVVGLDVSEIVELLVRKGLTLPEAL